MTHHRSIKRKPLSMKIFHRARRFLGTPKIGWSTKELFALNKFHSSALHTKFTFKRWNSANSERNLFERKWLKFIRFSPPLEPRQRSDSRLSTYIKYDDVENVFARAGSIRHNIHIIIHGMQKTFVLFIPLVILFRCGKWSMAGNLVAAEDYLQVCQFWSFLRSSPRSNQ